MSKINIVDKLIKNETLVKYGEFLWQPCYSQYSNGNDDQSYEISGPFCKNCRAPFWIGNEPIPKGEKVTCKVCDKSFTLKYNFQDVRSAALQSIYSYLNSDKEVIALDTPISNVFDKEEDDTHIVKVFLSQKDGRKTALIYVIEKAAKGEKIQMFLDIENEQIRFDAKDLPPMKMLAKMKVEFKDSKHEVDYKK